MTAALLMAWSTAAAAQEPLTIVFGKVRSAAGVAVARADVWIEGTTLRAVTSDSGEFQINGAPSGRVSVFVRRLGYFPRSRRVSLNPGDALQLDFYLDDLGEQLDSVLVTAEPVTSPRMRDFRERQSGGNGIFISREDIERRHYQRAVDIFRSVVGVRIVTDAAGGNARLVSGRMNGPGGRNATRSCALQFYIDGAFLSPGTFSMDEITPDQIEAIEIYRGPSEVPARFRQQDTACGLVIIWTREPPPAPKKP